MSGLGCPCAWPCDRAPENAPLMVESESIAWARGDVLWAADTPGDWVLAVCTGAVGFRHGGQGLPGRLVDIAVRGDLAGEEAASNSTRPSACVGLVAGKGRRLNRASLLRRLADKGGWNTVLCVSARRSAVLAERLHAASAGTVEQRVAALLIGLADRIGLRDARGTLVPLPLPRIDLAHLAGCREETVVRRMKAWERASLVDTLREGFVIRDVPALRALTRTGLTRVNSTTDTAPC